MRKERKHYTPEEKVSILRRHLIDKVPVEGVSLVVGGERRLNSFYATCCFNEV